MTIELTQTEPAYWTVVIGDRFADMLNRDEALAVVAATLFASPLLPPYLHTYEQWCAREKHWKTHGRWKPPVALLPYPLPVREPNPLIQAYEVYMEMGPIEIISRLWNERKRK